MTADLIFYALIAAGLVFWLRSVLGTRHGDERERPNLYTAQSIAPDKSAVLAEENQVLSPQDLISSLATNAKDALSIDNENAAAGLLEIAAADRQFDIYHFLEGAQDAFVIIVESFAEGGRATLKELLDAPVYEAFENVIAAREKNGEKHSSEIHAIKKAEVTEARIQGKKAFITVRFTAEETALAKDRNGEIISGHPDKVTEMHDIWVFGRETKSRDPRWFLYETRGDFDGDNESVPNTD